MITRSEAVIVLDAGPSSLGFWLYNCSADALGLVARGRFAGIGTAPCFDASDHHAEPLAGGPLPAGHEVFDHSDAFRYLAGWLRTRYGERMAILAVGHRFLHGGGDFGGPVLITDEVLQTLEESAALAPLHMPHNLAGVKAVCRLRPDLPQVACFDTAFHRGRSRAAEIFGLPAHFFQKGLRRWGFNGLSYESIVASLAKLAPQLTAGRVIAAYLGHSASLCAISRGRGVDSTMSFSVLDGLPGGTQCGSLDPGAMLFLMQQMSREQLETLLYTGSGLLGISRISSDMRVLLASRDPHAAEAVDYFVYRVIREIGSLAAALGGLDALVFTGGIGLDAPLIRSRVCRGLAWLGVAIDPPANERCDSCISPQGQSPSVWVIPTCEESVIAAHTWRIVSMLPQRTTHPCAARDDRTAPSH